MKLTAMKRATPARYGWLSQAIGRPRPWHVVMLFVVIYVGVTLAWHDWDPMAFVVVGGAFDPSVPADSLGYDGQFAYQIARHPLEGWRYVDTPAYRYQRILYPMIARVISLGIPKLLPWAMILINVLALPIGTALTEMILVEQGASRWYALTYGLFIGLLMPVRFDLTEPLAFLLVQTGVLIYSRGRPRIAGSTFALAALTREVTLLFPLGYALHKLRPRRWREGLLWGSLVAAPFASWQIILRLWLGEWGIGSGGALSMPFEWIPFHGWWRMAFHDRRAFALMSLFVVPLALAPALLSLISAVKDLLEGNSSPVTWALLTNAAVFPFLPTSNVLDPFGLSRITAGLAVAVLNFGARKRGRRTLNYALLWIATVVFIYKDSIVPRS